jgi:hypothetical protein
VPSFSRYEILGFFSRRAGAAFSVEDERRLLKYYLLLTVNTSKKEVVFVIWQSSASLLPVTNESESNESVMEEK